MRAFEAGFEIGARFIGLPHRNLVSPFYSKGDQGAARVRSEDLIEAALRMRPYGVTTPYEFFTASRDYVLTDELIARITTPVLVTSPDHEQFWPGQSQELFDKLTSRKAIVAFTEAEGADSHCEPAGSGIRGERIFDWLGEQVPA